MSASEWAAYTFWVSTSANECVKANAVWAHTSALEPAFGTSSVDARLAHNHTASCILNIFPPPTPQIDRAESDLAVAVDIVT